MKSLSVQSNDYSLFSVNVYFENYLYVKHDEKPYERTKTHILNVLAVLKTFTIGGSGFETLIESVIKCYTDNAYNSLLFYIQNTEVFAG